MTQPTTYLGNRLGAAQRAHVGRVRRAHAPAGAVQRAHILDLALVDAHFEPGLDAALCMYRRTDRVDDRGEGEGGGWREGGVEWGEGGRG